MKKLLTSSLLILFTFSLMTKENSFNIEVKAYDEVKCLSFARESSSTAFTINNDDISTLLNIDFSWHEKQYLENDTFSITYENKIPTTYVTTSLNETVLTVEANPYSYTDENGNEHTWYPLSSSYGNTKKDFVLNGNRYECVFDNITDNLSIINVEYTMDLPVSSNFYNTFVNRCYNVADYYVSNDIEGQYQDEYDIAYSSYLGALAEYNQYLEDLAAYPGKLDKYNEYLDKKAEYEENLKEYNRYLNDCEEYQNDLDAYNNYVALLNEYNAKIIEYENYLAALAIWEENLEENEAAYADYIDRLSRCKTGLDAMALIKVPMTNLKRTVYDAVLGSTVTQVLSRKEDLTTLGASEAVIDDAADATIVLREVFTDYFSLGNDQDKYTYYKTNYKSIKANIEKLFRSLEKLYRSGVIKTTMTANGYEEKYLILVAQLGTISYLIDDKTVYNYEGNISPKYADAKTVTKDFVVGGKTFTNILEGLTYEDTDSAYPNFAYPNEPAMLKPEKVDEPAPLTIDPVQMPVKPTVVNNPGNAPEVVEKPIYPTAIEAPVLPTLQKLPEDIKNLVDDYKDNVLIKRAEKNSDTPITVKSSFNKDFINTDIINIEFRTVDDTTIKAITCDKGSYIVFDAILPTKDGDNIYSEYAFDSWVYEDGTKLDLNNVTKEGFVYPTFKGVKYTQYEISFDVEGNITKYLVDYGSMPEYTGALFKDSDDTYFYTFASWDKEIEAVTENTTYTAIFNSNYLLEDDDNYVSLNYDDNTTIIDATNLDVDKINISNILEHVEDIEDKDMVIKYKNYSISLSSSTIRKFKNDNVNTIEVVLDVINDKDYLIKFLITDENGNNRTYLDKIDVKIDGLFDTYHSYLYDETDKSLTRANIKKDKLSFTATLANEYSLYRYFKITTNQDNNLTIELDKTSYKVGENVTFTLIFNDKNISIRNAKIVADGDIINVDGNSFTMLDKDLFLIVEYDYLNYEISFIVDDEIINTKYYHFGDEIVFPRNPIKASDENYSYKFVRWDNEATKVTENSTYRAIFEKTERKNDTINQKKGIVKPILIGIGAFHVIFQVSLGFFLILLEKKYHKK